MQPFSKLRKAFLENGILVDSSSSLGAYNPKPDQSYDFRVMPHKEFYRCEHDVCCEEVNGKLLEIPISSYNRNILHILADKFCQYLGWKNRVTDGTHVRKNDTLGIPHKESRWKKIFGKRVMLSFSQTASISVFLIILFSRKHLLCAIDHPKDMSKLTIAGIKIAGRLRKTVFYKDYLSKIK